MFKKIICIIIGHNLNIKKCPFTGIELSTCLRCSPIQSHSAMQFN